MMTSQSDQYSVQTSQKILLGRKSHLLHIRECHSVNLDKTFSTPYSTLARWSGPAPSTPARFKAEFDLNEVCTLLCTLAALITASGLQGEQLYQSHQHLKSPKSSNHEK
jgi:hypothetical protein